MASSPCGTLVRVSNGSFHEIQSAMPRTAGVSGNVPVEKGIKMRVVGGLPARRKNVLCWDIAY
ncbi:MULTISPECIES: hypothetical protein [Bacteroidales]|uniref:hypothetical protein n=1 Tax=Bacteroidales TaxID=171549 RepID=UPI001D05DB61|nr:MULTISPECIES: hypothetical protein [Bacteroidales]MCB6306875.1 hypothetical protein [Parabacteroides merdae]MCG4893288.1 hypothetical protein [Parabacteroides merdae]MCG4937840.1 hypothetical protein [Parabacteroides merdae]